ncbi:MAG TPA: DUF1508 domain-containing protein [Pyrinomonadaceae bacterium]|nr:DUF1508 domain-containing protein [Pyrinomonadaceae bacterium]
MKTKHEMLEDKLKGLNAYIKELKDKAAKHGTQSEHYEEDLMEAEHNLKYYEGEMARLKGLSEEEPDGTTYLVYEDAAGEWRWQLRAANKRIIADSGEGYHNKQDCLHGITLVKDSKDAPVKDRK